jgi:hypothetical protein
MYNHYSRNGDELNPGMDVIVSFDGGHTLKGKYALKKNLFAKIEVKPQTVELYPLQQGLQYRKDFALKRHGEFRRKVAPACDLSREKVVGAECMYWGGKNLNIPERPHLFLKCPGLETSKSPYLLVPLPNPPEILPQVIKQ